MTEKELALKICDRLNLLALSDQAAVTALCTFRTPLDKEATQFFPDVSEEGALGLVGVLNGILAGSQYRIVRCTKKGSGDTTFVVAQILTITVPNIVKGEEEESAKDPSG